MKPHYITTSEENNIRLALYERHIQTYVFDSSVAVTNESVKEHFSFLHEVLSANDCLLQILRKCVPNTHWEFITKEDMTYFHAYEQVRKLVCVWCCKEVESSPCEICGNDSVFDAMLPHAPHWSRKTLTEVECKVCGRSGPYSIQGEPGNCPGIN